LFVYFDWAGSIVEVRLSLDNGAIGQVFEVSEWKILLRGNIGGVSNDRECLAHHRSFGQSLHICLFKFLKGFARKA